MGGEKDITVGDSTLHLSSGRLARFTDGCAVGQHGDTTVMVTAVGKKQNTQASFMPLTVDYRQKAAAAGRIPTNHLRREIRTSDQEILTSRVIDRSLRPLFPPQYFAETQIMCNLLAVDGCHDPDVLSINTASAALSLSDIPWHGPVGAVRVGCVDKQIIINPTRKQLRHSSLNLIVTGAKNDEVVMLEGSAEDMPLSQFKKAVRQGVQHTQAIIQGINDFRESHGKTKREVLNMVPITDEIEQAVRSLAELQLRTIFTDVDHHKISRDVAVQEVRGQVLAACAVSFPDTDSKIISDCFNTFTKSIFRELVFETNLRCDGRSMTDLRPITCQTDLYKPLHGSAMFQRGQTQVLCTVTFDSPGSAAKVDTISALIGGMKEKNFFLNYEFPPYATNETGRSGGGNRRELGHGALAEKALRPVMPSDFPFTTRLSAEVLESNGSSSMATVCGGSLALMDAGVPISNPVAGIAIGVMKQTDADTGEHQYHILTDLLGIEDYMGDMDFKMAGTAKGVTAIQADIKLAGVPLSVIEDAMQAAQLGKAKILTIMAACRKKSRASMKDNGPVLETLNITAAQRPQFLGPGGYNLRKLQADAGVSIVGEEDGKFQMFAPNKDALAEATERIQELLKDCRDHELEFGAIYNAKIVEIRDIGVMVTMYNNMSPALIHTSQLDTRKVNHPSALDMEVGQEIKVKYFGRDPANGRMRLSRKVIYSTATALTRTMTKPSTDTKSPWSSPSPLSEVKTTQETS